MQESDHTQSARRASLVFLVSPRFDNRCDRASRRPPISNLIVRDIVRGWHVQHFRSRLRGDYFWLTDTFPAGAGNDNGVAFGAIGLGEIGLGEIGTLGGVRCDGEALPLFCMTGRRCTTLSLPGAGAM